MTLVLAGPALAFHRDLSAVTGVTLSGDTDLPRIPPQGRKVMVLAQDAGGGEEIVRLSPFTTFAATTQVSPTGGHPAVSYDGKTIVWEANGQIMLQRRGVQSAGPNDPSATSANPSLDKGGKILVFESEGDLTGVGVPSVKRVYVHDLKANTIQLASSGQGMSGDAMVSAKGQRIAFVSTSDPNTGVDAGTSQIWTGSLVDLPARRVTTGAGASTEPLVSDDGRLVAFSSTSDLAGDEHDTGVKQIFVYDDHSGTFARLTNEPSGCARPAVSRVRSDWRITFVCAGQAYFHMLRENRRYHVLTPGGVVQSIVPDMGVHFVTLSTTADLFGGGAPNAGYRIFMRNLFAAGAELVPGSSATWFPYQGISGF